MYEDSKNNWFICPKPRIQSRLRLFCFPYSGSGSSIFFQWPENLPADVEVWLAQLPGRGNRLKEPPFSRLSALVEVVAENIYALLNQPFALFGHSMGALVCFELARYLRKVGRPEPVHLFVSGRGAPHVPGTGAPIHELPEPEFIEELKSMHGMAPEVLASEELMQLLIPILRADFSVCETYDYQEEQPLNCSISAYGGLQDDGVNSDQLDAWRDLTGGSFLLHMFPGDHFFINTARQLLLRTMSRELNEILNLLML